MREGNVGSRKGWVPLARIAALGAVVVASGAISGPGCLDRPIERVEPRTTSTIVERLTQHAVDKIDLLLVIDNSRSMADKQEILHKAVHDLVGRLVNPWCVDANTGLYDPGVTQPSNPVQQCPDGTEREFSPLDDIHVGVISSSLGGHGSDACDPGNEPTNDDHAHLITRGDGVVTYENKGFLWWHPGPSDSEDEVEAQMDSIIENLRKIVIGVGETGCGYEASMEAWYRFLVQPDPWQTVELQGDKATMIGDDEALLEQRADFLRPDSLLAVIVLSDENDCSIRDGGINWIVAQQQMGGGYFHMPRATAECESDPSDPCCYSCGQVNPPSGCNTDDDDCSSPLSPSEDHNNLRCYDQKRRFGIDFLYPISRYVDGLTAPMVPDRTGKSEAYMPNPLYQDLNPDDDNTNIRDTGLVFLAGIVGVPWHDIARKNEDGEPDLINGLNAEGQVVGGYQSGDELALNDTWNLILGDPSNYHSNSNALPDDPLMWESVGPRDNTEVTPSPPAPLVYWDPPGDGMMPHPITEEDIGVNACNSINGHEYAYLVVDNANDDLQYACTFPLDEERVCSGANPPTACDCLDAGNDNPLCEQTPCSGAFGQNQYRAKAYPGIRHLQVLQAIGTQGIVASIAPAEQADENSPIYGYRPAVNAIVDRLKLALGGQCLPRTLVPDVSGQVSCLIIEATFTPAEQCSCDAAGRQPVDARYDAAIDAIRNDPTNQNWTCFCQITQAVGDQLRACQGMCAGGNVCTEQQYVANGCLPCDATHWNVQNPGSVQDAHGDNVNGWCYVDATTAPPVGNPAIVSDCPSTEQRLIRFVGDPYQTKGTLFITCSGETG